MQVTHAPRPHRQGRPQRQGAPEEDRPRPSERRGARAPQADRRSRGAFPARKLSLARDAPGPRARSLPPLRAGPARTHTHRLREGVAPRPRQPPSTPKAGNATRPGSTPGSNPTHSTGASSRLPRRRPRGAQECEVGVAAGWGPGQPSELRARARGRRRPGRRAGGAGPHGGGAGGGRESTPVCRGAGPPAA